MSNSTPLARRTKTASIFGDVDVSKLGNSKRTSPSLRSTPLRSYEDDEEDLFGGKRTSRTRVTSKASSVRQSPEPPKNSLPDPLPPVIKEPVKQPAVKEPVKQPTVKEPVKQPTLKQPTIKESVKQPPVVEEEEEKPSFFASASRFFKSSGSKPSSSASSVASASNSPKLKNDPVPEVVQQKTLPKPPTPRKVVTPPPQQQEEEEEEEKGYQLEIEDEATRAFADDVMSFKSHYASLTTSDLALPQVESKRLLPSASTPTTLRTDMDDPWFDGSNQTQPIMNLMMEPSVSSPLHKVSVQDIEPEKRNAFADLITSWNTGQTLLLEPVREEFFHEQVAEEQHIGFATLPPRDSISSTSEISVLDYNEEENPWH